VSSPLALRLRIAAGRVYAAVFGAIAAAGRLLIRPDSELGRLRRRIANAVRPQPKLKVWLLIREFADAYPDARFVQIGSNDGKMEDPLRESILRKPWRGVLVEPVPQLFDALRANYAGRDGLAFENVAVSSREGTMPFYHLAAPPGAAALPVWAAGLGSFSREVVVSHAHRIPGIEQYVVQREVPVIGFETLCRRNGVTSLDLLHIDAEGHDYEILKSVDLERWQPRLLIYERHHLSAAQQGEILARVEKLGYAHMSQGLDTFCLRLSGMTARDEPVLAIWRVLEGIEEIPA
jgi:FkbM family methyltransferase